MIHIDDNNITITRGDTALLTLSITDQDDQPYIPVEGDNIYLTIKPDINNEYYVLKKKFNDIQKLSITKSDTIDLNFGKYFYDVRIENGSQYDTIICSGEFIIDRGTANAGN